MTTKSYEVVTGRLSGAGTDTLSKDLMFTATVSRDAEGLKAILVNRSTKSDRPTSFLFEQPYRLVTRIDMTGPNKDAVNARLRREITVEEVPVKPHDVFERLVVPARSVVVLHLEPTPEAP